MISSEETQKVKICYIVSVGTSLVTNYNKSVLDSGRIDPIEFESIDNRCWEDIEKNPDVLLSNRDNNNRGIQTTYIASYTRLFNWLNRGNGRSSLEESSAELSTLLNQTDFKGFSSEDRVILLFTRTYEGLLCAHVLKNILKDRWEDIREDSNTMCPNDFVEIVSTEGLGKADDPVFQEMGLPNFLAKLEELITKYENDYEVILVPTGGYKALIPYMVIAGILHKLRILYVYEDSALVLVLPKIPIGLDLERWRREKIPLQMSLSSGPSSLKDEDFRNLIEKKDDGYSLNAVGQFLENHYNRLSGLSPLQTLTTGTHLLDYLKNNDLKEKFFNLAKLDHLIWKGDRVPEMVEHSVRHHTDLFEIAEQILLPIFDKKPNFLDPHEIFVLLCAFYFHDCGHVIGSIQKNDQKIRLLPPEIREYHHILGYERLAIYNNQEVLPNPGLRNDIYQALGWGERNGYNEVWEKYMKAIATVGLFHRKKMPISSGETPYNWRVLDKPYEPLLSEVWDAKFENNSKISLPLLVCLLRIIDSLDVKSSRSGDPLEVGFTLTQLEVEEKEEEARAERLRTILDKYKSAKYLNDLDGKINCLESEKDTKTKLEAIRDCLKSIGGDSDDLIFEYAYAKTSAIFKKIQRRHYGKHLLVKNIKIDYKNGDGSDEKIYFTISLEPNYDIEPQLLKRLGIGSKDIKLIVNSVLDEMKKEYEVEESNSNGQTCYPVKAILQKEGISFNYANIK